jgi:hypothetical protein
MDGVPCPKAETLRATNDKTRRIKGIFTTGTSFTTKPFFIFARKATCERFFPILSINSPSINSMRCCSKMPSVSNLSHSARVQRLRGGLEPSVTEAWFFQLGKTVWTRKLADGADRGATVSCSLQEVTKAYRPLCGSRCTIKQRPDTSKSRYSVIPARS